MCTYSISVDDTILERVKPVLPDDKAVEAWMQSQVDILLLQLAETLSHQSKAQVSLSSRLRGIAQAPRDFDYKQELANRIEV
jgi:hypothetical protein